LLLSKLSLLKWLYRVALIHYIVCKNGIKWEIVAQILEDGRFRSSITFDITMIECPVMVWRLEEGTVVGVVDLAQWHYLLLR